MAKSGQINDKWEITREQVRQLRDKWIQQYDLFNLHFTFHDFMVKCEFVTMNEFGYNNILEYGIREAFTEDFDEEKLLQSLVETCAIKAAARDLFYGIESYKDEVTI